MSIVTRGFTVAVLALTLPSMRLEATPVVSDLLALRSTDDKGKPFAAMGKIKSAGLGGREMDDIITFEEDEAAPGGAASVGYQFEFAVTPGRLVFVTLQAQAGNLPDIRLHPALVAYMIEPQVCGCTEFDPHTTGAVSDWVELDARKDGEFFFFNLTFFSDPNGITLPVGTPEGKKVLAGC